MYSFTAWAPCDLVGLVAFLSAAHPPALLIYPWHNMFGFQSTLPTSLTPSPSEPLTWLLCRHREPRSLVTWARLGDAERMCFPLGSPPGTGQQGPRSKLASRGSLTGQLPAGPLAGSSGRVLSRHVLWFGSDKSFSLIHWMCALFMPREPGTGIPHL